VVVPLQAAADRASIYDLLPFITIAAPTEQEIRTIHVGSGPHGLTLFPQPGRFSIGHNGVYR